MPITDIVEVVNKMCLSELIVLNELVAENISKRHMDELNKKLKEEMLND